MSNHVGGEVAEVPIGKSLLWRGGRLIEHLKGYGPVVGVLVDLGQAFCEDHVGADAPVEVVVGERQQNHAKAVLQGIGTAESLEAELQVGDRTPGMGCFRGQEPDRRNRGADQRFEDEPCKGPGVTFHGRLPASLPV